MPELPEVETVKNGLLKKVKGRKIIKVNVLYKGIIAYPDVSTFIKEIENKEIKNITRRGKFLIYDLSDYYLLSHLRMEGKYFIKELDDEISKHDHVIFTLDNSRELRYNDTRKFGKMYLFKKEELYSEKSPLYSLGLEPWSEELIVSYLKDKLNKNKPIKSLLLDQSIIAGIGNIYADEILFSSGINPNKNGCKLTNKEISSIIDNTREILEKAISLGGTTIHTYSSVDGVTGRFQQELMVHGKCECFKCNNKIIKISVGGRGTYYCPNCQK